MRVINYSLQSSIMNQLMYVLREKNIQRDRLRFRHNLELMGEILAYEISKTLNYRPTRTETQFGSLDVATLADDIVVATIFRAGLPVHQGFLKVFPWADSALIAASRHVDGQEKASTEITYDGSASTEGKVLIIVDTMMATGSTVVDVYQKLLTHGQPSRVVVAGIIASKRAVSYIETNLPSADLHVVAIDDSLNADLYIVPGLGDAGDLIYGTKIS